MKILITGVCGFTGNTLAPTFQDLDPIVELCGADNLVRPDLLRSSQKPSSIGTSNGLIRVGSLDRWYFVIWV
jgi:nucleoside-diphosphate-sugar epimerase